MKTLDIYNHEINKRVATSAFQGTRRHPDHIDQQEEDMAVATLPHKGTIREGSILTLDLGTKTGWALNQTDGTITSGTVEFKPGRFEGGGMVFLRFKKWLNEVKAFAAPIKGIWFEEVCAHAGVHAAHAYGGFLAHLTAFAEQHGIPVGARPTPQSVTRPSKFPAALLAKPGYFIAPIAKGSKTMVVWRRTGKGKKQRMTLMYVFSREVHLKPRFGFNTTVRKVAMDRFPKRFAEALQQAMATAR